MDISDYRQTTSVYALWCDIENEQNAIKQNLAIYFNPFSIARLRQNQPDGNLFFRNIYAFIFIVFFRVRRNEPIRIN